MTHDFPTLPEFFKAVTGHDPYDWQIELAQRVRGGEWPARIDVPTGLGKTATIVVAVYDLARQLHQQQLSRISHQRTAPQRIFHVVNRRTLVNDTDAFIREFAERVNSGEHPHIAPIREALRGLLGPGDELPVAAGAIHGDTPRDLGWLRATGCSIVTLTPHQFVSRLLMRGFAVSPSRRPIDAGLVGIDRLVLFDEPHLAIPAVQAILDAEHLQGRASEPLQVPIGCTVLLGATLPDALVKIMDRDSVLRLDVSPPSPGEVGQGSPADRRLHAPRRLRLESINSSSDVAFAKAMATRAVKAAGHGQSVVVFANTVTLAQQVYELLTTNANFTGKVHLITSRFRPLDRKGIGAIEGITVATQCLEVGVDVSFSALVTEAAPWDALVQRLGRLNRDGELASAGAHVIVARSGAVRGGTKAVYCEEIVQAAIDLFKQAGGGTLEGLSVSPAALAELRSRDDAQALDGETPRAATLHSGLVALMTHTRPTPSPDLPVEAFVSGPDRPVNRDIDVAWRDRVDALDDASFSDVYAAETVSVPRAALARLLRPVNEADKIPISDLPDAVVDDTAVRGAALRWGLDMLRVWDSGVERWRAPSSLDEVLRAERVILQSSIGGYQSDLGWTGDSGPVEDLHFVAALDSLAGSTDSWRRRRLTLSLNQSVVEQARRRDDLDDTTLQELAGLMTTLREADQTSLELVGEEIQDRLGAALKTVLQAVMRGVATARVRVDGFAGLTGKPDPRAVFCTVTVPEQRRDGTAGPVALSTHLEQVGAWAEQDGRAAGLDGDVVAALGTAGRWHDVGKAYPPFQRYLAGCPSAEVTGAGITLPDGTRYPLLAKPLAEVAEETGSSGAADRAARAAAGLAAGCRHEAGSVAAFRSSGAGKLTEHPMDKLTGHLGGSHHGWYRPIMPPLPDIQLLGYSHADDFAELNNHFGPWGLAYLEAVLRLADWRASAHPDGADAIEPSAENAPLSVEPGRWDELLGSQPSSVPVAGADSHALAGLATHPLTGWFASAGLLAAAVDAGDNGATLHWEGSTPAPQIPVLTTRLPLLDILSWAFNRERWAEADALVADMLGAKGMSLRRKNQKLAPAAGLRKVLRSEMDAMAPLLMGLLGDAAQVDAKGQVALPIVPFANNSSYPAVALRSLERATAIDDCLGALANLNLGYTRTACDGGMDRPRAAAPLVNGLGAPGDERSVRTALAPLALYGMGRLGSTGAAPFGVTRSAGRLQLQLPVPTRPVTLEALRSMTISVRSPRSWSWSQIGGQWIYAASREYLSDRKDIDIVWSGRVVSRGEAK